MPWGPTKNWWIEVQTDLPAGVLTDDQYDEVMDVVVERHGCLSELAGRVHLRVTIDGSTAATAAAATDEAVAVVDRALAAADVAAQIVGVVVEIDVEFLRADASGAELSAWHHERLGLSRRQRARLVARRVGGAVRALRGVA